MNFKEAHLEDELKAAPKLLRELAKLFELLAKKEFNKEVTVTRIFGKIKGDSGVHAAKRAIDFRDKQSGETHTFTPAERTRLLGFFNAYFFRTDGKPTLHHHSFKSGEEHFHLQIPYDIIVYRTDPWKALINAQDEIEMTGRKEAKLQKLKLPTGVTLATGGGILATIFTLIQLFGVPYSKEDAKAAHDKLEKADLRIEAAVKDDMKALLNTFRRENDRLIETVNRLEAR